MSHGNTAQRRFRSLGVRWSARVCLVTDIRLFGPGISGDVWDGIGNFVFLADAQFLPIGETRMHNHREVDVISVMVKGRVKHEGSLENGQLMESHQVQVRWAVEKNSHIMR